MTAASLSVRTLPPEARVRRRADYLRVQKQSLRVAVAHFVFLITATPAAVGAVPARPRLGIIASKALGNAVVRARAKRLVRAAFRELGARFPSGTDVVVLVRGDITKLGLADVLVEWRGAEANVVRRAKAALAAEKAGPAPVTPPPARPPPLLASTDRR